MGAWTFATYSHGSDVNAAFRDAVAEAATEYGHGGYTGTIAEKTDYTLITGRAMSRDQATTLAHALLRDNDPRIADKWGPAGAIAVKHPTRTIRLDRLTPSPHDPACSDVDTLTRLARERRLISDAETITGGYRDGRDSYLATVAKDPAALAAQTEPDGWLFFGWASG